MNPSITNFFKKRELNAVDIGKLVTEVAQKRQAVDDGR